MLLCFTANHRNADLDLLEKLSVGAPAATRTLVDDELFVAGAVVLATCNRFEAYLDIDEPLTGGEAVAVESVVETMADASGIPVERLRESVAVHRGEDAAAHLFAVTSGLESIVVGEDEISGQVRRALDTARVEGTTSRELERLFQKAAHTSRGIRSRTSLGGSHRSLVRFALELASSRIPDWSDVEVLVVGTGRYAATTVTALRARGAVDLRVFSPSGRAAAFAARHGLVAEPSFAAAAARADVVITCTADAVVHEDAFTPGHRVIVIDLGLPRNVDPAVGAVDGVELLDLETIRLHAPLEEFSAHADARALVGDAAAEFAADRAAGPAITKLRGEVLGLVEAEVSRARARGAGPEVEEALRHLAGVLLHKPSVRIRELAVEGRLDEAHQALETLHGLAVEPSLPVLAGDAIVDAAIVDAAVCGDAGGGCPRGAASA
ncbi:glutamyl-tRNA reductase [Microbacterium aurantiacum]|uniref:glutamyl-tRNA reductase n=1 Tax=Microbacterium aurantiacum TaxID=162393 RepID=UPI0009EAAB79|nr:glutamyl-tRNA reductase [Microbacterium chocolatum]